MAASGLDERLRRVRRTTLGWFLPVKLPRSCSSAARLPPAVDVADAPAAAAAIQSEHGAARRCRSPGCSPATTGSWRAFLRRASRCAGIALGCSAAGFSGLARLFLHGPCQAETPAKSAHFGARSRSAIRIHAHRPLVGRDAVCARLPAATVDVLGRAQSGPDRELRSRLRKTGSGRIAVARRSDVTGPEADDGRRAMHLATAPVEYWFMG